MRTRPVWLAASRPQQFEPVCALEHQKIAFNPKGLVSMKVEPLSLLDVPPENLQAFKVAASELAKSPNNLVQPEHGLYTLPGTSHSWSGEMYTLALDGQIVAKYIADD